MAVVLGQHATKHERLWGRKQIKNVGMDAYNGYSVSWCILNQYNVGLKVNGNFITKAYNNIIEELAKSFNVKIEKS